MGGTIFGQLLFFMSFRYGSWRPLDVTNMMSEDVRPFSTIENLILRFVFCFSKSFWDPALEAGGGGRGGGGAQKWSKKWSSQNEVSYSGKWSHILWHRFGDIYVDVSNCRIAKTSKDHCFYRSFSKSRILLLILVWGLSVALLQLYAVFPCMGHSMRGVPLAVL